MPNEAQVRAIGSTLERIQTTCTGVLASLRQGQHVANAVEWHVAVVLLEQQICKKE